MEKVRSYLSHWGIAWNSTTLGVSLCVFVTFLAVLTVTIFPSLAQLRWMRILLALIAIPGLAILFGSLYRPLMWDFSDKRGRARIEKETAVKILQEHYKEEEKQQRKNEKKS